MIMVGGTELIMVPLHGIGSRRDLPLPFGFVVGGAAAALLVSFVVLFLAWRRPRFAGVAGRLPARVSGTVTRLVDGPPVRVVITALVLLAYLWAGLALAGGKDVLTNPVFGFVFVWMWVGLVPLSVLFGPWWRVTNPLRVVHRGLCRLAGIDPAAGLVTLPRAVGCRPAAVGLFGFAWLELIQPDRTTLPVLRLWALAWLVVMIIGAVVFGRGWIRAADPFETYATAVAQLSPWRRVGRRVTWVNPLAGLTAWDPPTGSVAVIAALLGSTAYDSFSTTSFWIATVQSSSLPPVLWQTAGLLGMIAIVGLTFGAATRAMARFRADGSLPADAMPRLMSGSVVPIVIGYAVAHYATLLVVEGQRTAIGWSDPLGRGWNVFGSARMGVDGAVFDHPTLVAVIQVTAIVGGHLLGIVAAHEKALHLLAPDRRSALLGQLPLLVVMIGYTCAGLLLLFSP